MTREANQISIAFLGIGLMGAPMARRLLAAGHVVHAWNRTRAKADALAPAGAQVHASAADAVRDAEIVITMLQDGPTVTDVVASIMPALRAGTLVVDMSSTRQSEAVSLHASLQAGGVACLDAPVSGGVLGAEAGTLAIMAGGSADAYARAEPLLRQLGRPTHVGPAGCGQLAKLCNQLIVGGTLAIVAEALLLAEAGGADPAAVRAAIRGGFAESRILEVHGQRMLERNFMPGGQVRSQAKDLHNVLAAAAQAGIALPVTSLVTDTWNRLGATHPGADQAAILLALEKINAGQRVGDGPDRLPD